MKEAEEIIISKRFFELTPSELEAVKEFAANEEDYEAMRWFLQQTKSSFAEEKIEASPSLRAGVMAHLNQQPSGKTISLNGVGAFLFPTQKKFYQYPAFQIAAVGILLVGFVFMYDGTLSEGDQGLASNDLQKVQPVPENDSLLDEENLTTETEVVSPSEVREDGDTRVEPVTVSPLSNKGEVSKNVDLEVSIVGGSTNLLAMSVAEESRFSADEKLTNQQPYGETNVVAPDQNFYRVENAVVKGIVVDEIKNAPTDDIVLADGLKKESNNKDQDKSKTSVNSKTDVNAPATTTVTSNENSGYSYTTAGATNREKAVDEDKEAGEFLTGSAGGVFGDTASEPETEKVMDAETPAKDFNLSQTKELRGLFFVVK